MKKAYLVLEDGQVFEGRSFGVEISGMGELVFSTGMCGYIETLTDPSYYGQIVLQTFPLIGNYGIIEDDLPGAGICGTGILRRTLQFPDTVRYQSVPEGKRHSGNMRRGYPSDHQNPAGKRGDERIHHHRAAGVS